MTELSLLLAGAAGKMGREAVKAITEQAGMTLWAASTRQSALGQDVGTQAGIDALGIDLLADLKPVMSQAPQPAVLVDLSHGTAAYENALAALENQIPVVIGATGLSSEQIEDLRKLSESRQCGVLLAPNFSIGALLLMDFAAQAAKYFNWVEIIELHHENKRDAPSGTAIKTAKLIAEQNANLQVAYPDFAARGELIEGIPVHSVRLPGLLAHQEVLFGDPGQLLTLRHDSSDRKSFMPGLMLAIDKVRDLKGLVYGLETML